MLLRYGFLLGLTLSLLAWAESALQLGWLPAPWYAAVLGASFLLLGWQLGAWAQQHRTRHPVSDPLSLQESPITQNPGGLLIEKLVDPAAPLSDREREVLHYLAEGLSNRQIGDHLFISENTVKTHLQNLYAKLEVQRRTQAVARARDLGLIP